MTESVTCLQIFTLFTVTVTGLLPLGQQPLIKAAKERTSQSSLGQSAAAREPVGHCISLENPLSPGFLLMPLCLGPTVLLRC